jgi:hypothetical protein
VHPSAIGPNRFLVGPMARRFEGTISLGASSMSTTLRLSRIQGLCAPQPLDANPPTSVNAQQWKKLSKRAYNQGNGRMNFSGGLSQFESCKGRETDPDCLGLDLRPRESWRDLWDEINCTYDGGVPCPTQSNPG